MGWSDGCSADLHENPIWSLLCRSTRWGTITGENEPSLKLIIESRTTGNLSVSEPDIHEMAATDPNTQDNRSDSIYHVAFPVGTEGPYSLAELRDLLIAGRVKPDDRVMCDGVQAAVTIEVLIPEAFELARQAEQSLRRRRTTSGEHESRRSESSTQVRRFRTPVPFIAPEAPDSVNPSVPATPGPSTAQPSRRTAPWLPIMSLVLVAITIWVLVLFSEDGAVVIPPALRAEDAASLSPAELRQRLATDWMWAMHRPGMNRTALLEMPAPARHVFAIVRLHGMAVSGGMLNTVVSLHKADRPIGLADLREAYQAIGALDAAAAIAAIEARCIEVAVDLTSWREHQRTGAPRPHVDPLAQTVASWQGAASDERIMALLERYITDHRAECVVQLP